MSRARGSAGQQMRLPPGRRSTMSSSTLTGRFRKSSSRRANEFAVRRNQPSRLPGRGRNRHGPRRQGCEPSLDWRCGIEHGRLRARRPPAIPLQCGIIAYSLHPVELRLCIVCGTTKSACGEVADFAMRSHGASSSWSRPWVSWCSFLSLPRRR